MVNRSASKVKPSQVALSGIKLQEDGSHRFALERWQSFRDHAMKVMKARFGKAVKSGRKTIKVPKGQIPADADLVVTLSHKEGIGFYLPDEGRWVVSFPQQHHVRGSKKEKATNGQFKRTIRMFKAARNRLVDNGALTVRRSRAKRARCQGTQVAREESQIHFHPAPRRISHAKGQRLGPSYGHASR